MRLGGAWPLKPDAVLQLLDQTERSVFFGLSALVDYLPQRRTGRQLLQWRAFSASLEALVAVDAG